MPVYTEESFLLKLASSIVKRTMQLKYFISSLCKFYPENYVLHCPREIGLSLAVMNKGRLKSIDT